MRTGVFWLVAAAVGLDLTVDDLNPIAGTIDPDPDLVTSYAARRARADAAAAEILLLGS